MNETENDSDRVTFFSQLKVDKILNYFHYNIMLIVYDNLTGAYKVNEYFVFVYWKSFMDRLHLFVSISILAHL